MDRGRVPGRRGCIAFLAIALLPGCDREVPDGPYARAKVIERLDEGIGGDMALGQPGDLLIENDQLRAVVLAGRNSLGPGLYGGSLVDIDKQWNNAALDGGRGLDQWNELFPLVSMNVPFAADPDSVYVLEEGSETEPAVIRVEGLGEPFITLLGALWGLVSMPDMVTVTDYIVEPGVPWLTMRTTASFDLATLEPEAAVGPPGDGADVRYSTTEYPIIQTGLLDGLAFGDFFLAGGSLDVFAPGIGFDEDGAVFRRNQDGDNIFLDPFAFPFVGAIADGVSYGLVPKEGLAFVPLFTASQTAVVAGLQDPRPALAAGEPSDCAEGAARVGGQSAGGGRFCPEDAFTYERYFLVGHGDIGSLVDQYVELHDVPHGTVSGRVVEQGSNLPVTGVDVFAFQRGAEHPWNQWRTDVRPDDDLPDGSFSGALPAGEWELLVHRQGRPDADQRLPITVEAGGEVEVRLELLRGGVLTFQVTDETGAPVPSKVTLFREDPSAPSTRQPALGDAFHAGDPEWVVFDEDGLGEVPLPPGDYYAVASRGLEYEIDVSDAFTIDAQRGHHLDLQVIRSVDTTGWISADFHVHSAPSHDSGVRPRDRVRTMVCEGVEFFATTDHDVLSDFAPVVEEMGLEEWVQSAVGVETTTVEVGHYLGFPLQRDFLADQGGAQDWTGKTPAEMIAALRQQGQEAGTNPVVFVAHPRDGILGFFDQYGFDPFLGTPQAPVFTPSALTITNDLISPENATMDFDALELFTGKRLDTHRTPTLPEYEGFAAGDGTDVYDWIGRTLEEQEALEQGVYTLTDAYEGVVDDWFTTLNLGYRFTAIGNSDTHGMTSTEAGCPRNFVMSDADDPAVLDDQTVADAVKDHRVVASYGPFLRMWVDGAEIGSEITADGPVEIQVEVQAPSWMDVDVVEIYENGTLIATFDIPPDSPDALRLVETFEATPTVDSWYVAIAHGDGTLAPVFTEVEIPYIPLEEAVTEALGVIEIVGSLLGEPTRFPKTYPIHPYAITNPVWVDLGGDGWTPPGRPAWLTKPR